MKLGTQILELSFDLLDFTGIIKHPTRSDSEVVYSKVNAKNGSLRATVLLSGINLFRECEDKETPAFLIHPEKAFTNIPTEVVLVAGRDIEFELLPCLEEPQNEHIPFNISTSWEVIPNRCLLDYWLSFGLLNHSTGLPHAGNSNLGRQFESLSYGFIDSIMELEVLSNLMFPGIIDAELESLTVGLDSSNYLFSGINPNFSTNGCSHIGIVIYGIYKDFVFRLEGKENGRYEKAGKGY